MVLHKHIRRRGVHNSLVVTVVVCQALGFKALPELKCLRFGLIYAHIKFIDNVNTMTNKYTGTCDDYILCQGDKRSSLWHPRG